MQHRDSRSVLSLLLVLGVGLLPTLGWAEDSAPVPDHAYIDFGDHWKCDRGFKRVAAQIGNTPSAREALGFPGS